MPTLVLRFPGGRYHATPWAQHVNEGAVEWPPSPWRLLRALLATGYTKLNWPADGPPPVARSLIEKLASQLPRYRLPEAVGTHSRHYMPLARFKNGREETALIFDTWARIEENGQLAARWDVNLTLDELELFGRLGRELAYLGRAESWVEGEVIAEDSDDSLFDVRVGEIRDRPGLGWEQVSLLATTSADEYSSWRSTAIRDAVTGLPPAARQRQIATLEGAHPRDLIDCLQLDTRRMQQLGWSQPPGTRKVFYWRRSDALSGVESQLAPRPPVVASVDWMLLAMSGTNGNRRLLPSVTRVLPQGELLHRALNFHASRLSGHSVVLSGCDESGRPLKVSHRHSHLLHLDLDGDAHLDHVLIWAPMGLDAAAQAAVRATRRTFMKRSPIPLRLAVAGCGAESDLSGLRSGLGLAVQAIFGGARLQARVWRSLTPFVPPRHLKRHGRNTLVGQITAELLARGFTEPERITVLDPREADNASMSSVGRSRHFVRRRRHGPQPPADCGFMLELRFAEEVRGPIALGYASHYGLGLFVNADG